MLELSSPELLFGRQKLFHLNDNAGKTLKNNNPCKVIVVFDQPDETLQPALKEMLDKLVQACKFNLDETVYLNARMVPEISLGDLQNEFNPVAVLVFGEVSISRNLTKLKKNFVYELNGVKIINTDALDVLVKNDPAKKALWAGLKMMFGV